MSVPIDWANVNWVYVAVLGVFVFFSTLVGNVVSLGHRGVAAVLSALVFAGIFVVYSYYPHHLPLPTTLTPQKPAAVVAPAPTAAPPPPAAPSPPRNPVTDITGKPPQ